LDDFHYICLTIKKEQKKVKTHKGVYELREIKESYLINGIQIVLDVLLKNDNYSGNRSKKDMYETLLEDIIKVAPSIHS